MILYGKHLNVEYTIEWWDDNICTILLLGILGIPRKILANPKHGIATALRYIDETWAIIQAGLHLDSVPSS